jgi:hypothetical protein
MQSLDHDTSLMQLYAIMGDGDDGCRRLRARDWCSASLSPPPPPPFGTTDRRCLSASTRVALPPFDFYALIIVARSTW